MTLRWKQALSTLPVNERWKIHGDGVHVLHTNLFLIRQHHIPRPAPLVPFLCLVPPASHMCVGVHV